MQHHITKDLPLLHKRNPKRNKVYPAFGTSNAVELKTDGWRFSEGYFARPWHGAPRFCERSAVCLKLSLRSTGPRCGGELKGLCRSFLCPPLEEIRSPLASHCKQDNSWWCWLYWRRTIVPKGIVRFRSCYKAVVNVFPHEAEPSCATRTGQYLLGR